MKVFDSCCSFEGLQRILDFSGSSGRRPSQDDTFRQSRKRPHDCADSAVPTSLTTDSAAATTAHTEGAGASPYPSVDRFITGQLSRGGVQGSIRRWTLFPVGMY